MFGYVLAGLVDCSPRLSLWLPARHPLPPFARSVEPCLWEPTVSILVSPRVNPQSFRHAKGLVIAPRSFSRSFLSQPPKAVSLSLFPNMSS